MSARDKSDLAFDLRKLAARDDIDRKAANHAAFSRSLGELSGKPKDIGDHVKEINDGIDDDVKEEVKDIKDKPKL